MHRSTARLLTAALALAVLAAPLAAQAGASQVHPAAARANAIRAHTGARLHVGALGAIPVRGTANKGRPINTSAASKALEYHGGPVMLSSTTYVIYWQPTLCGPDPCAVEAGYNNGINRYFGDAAADSGTGANVYSTLNQYYMVKHHHKKHVRYNQTFGGSIVDTKPFPTNGCTPVYGSSGVCLSDTQVRKEIKRVMADQAWTGGKSHAFFLALPSEVDTCYSASSCAFTRFCAYHSAFGLPDGTPVIYANIPYAGTNLTGCGLGHKTAPNSDDLDATLNATSHEHREMTNDPFGSGWWDDQSGYEGSDQCAYKFGHTSSPGGPNNGDFNQVINSNEYLVQMEWSNKSLGCKQSGS